MCCQFCSIATTTTTTTSDTDLALGGPSSTTPPSNGQREILPDHVKPTHYTLVITPNLDTCLFKGTVDIQLNVIKTTSTLVLNANELTIPHASLRWNQGKTENSSKATEIILDKPKETVTLHFPQPIQAGSQVILSLEFEGIHNDKMAGFYRSGYKNAQGEKKYMVVTQFEATDCRRCFPSFDEPNLKATFDITLNVPKDRTALSNMNAISEKVVSVDGVELKSVTFARTPIMSTYLVAMAVGEYDFVETKAYPKSPADAKPIDVRVYTLKGQSHQGKFGLEVAARTLEFFSSYFDISYPLPKMDLVAIPDFAAGAMENWGLVTYREICLLYDEKTTSASIKQRIAYVVGHELAHQWFGNLVTMDWWAELWLNEGFATFVGWMAVDNLFPEWKVWTQFVTNDYGQGLSLDALRSSHPIEVDVKSPSEINQIFDAISYSKGASVIRMLNAFLGQDVFMNGVRLYLKKHAYSNATTIDLWSALSQSSGKDIRTLMYSWTRKMGYPMVEILEESYSGGVLTLSLKQSRYLATGGSVSPEEETVWWIPLNVVTHLSPKTPLDLILTEKEAKVSFPYDDSPAGYFKLNFGTTGFYRVKMNQKQLSKLGSVLSKDLSIFDTTDRIGILTDAFALAVAGYGSTRGALDIIKAYEKENEYNVLEVVDGALEKILSCFYKEPEDVLTGIKELRRKIFAPKVETLGYEYPEKEDHLTTLKRSLAIRAAAASDDKKVLDELASRFHDFVGGNESRIHPNLRKTVFMTILAKSTKASDDFDKIVSVYQSTSSVDQKLSALSCLGAAPTVETLNKLLDMVLDPEQVKPQDIIYPLSLVGDSSSPNKELKLERLWSWVVKNWSLLHERYKASLSLLGRVLQSAIVNRIGLEFVEVVEAWARGDDVDLPAAKAQRSDELKTARRPLDQSLEKVRGHTSWVERDRLALSDWVKQQQK